MSRSLKEFRAALNGLVHNPSALMAELGRRGGRAYEEEEEEEEVVAAPRRGRGRGRGRVAEVIDFEEAAAPRRGRGRGRSRGRGRGRAAAAPARPRRGEDVHELQETIRRLRREVRGERSAPSAAPGRAASAAREELTREQARIIGQSIGGMKTICPDAVERGLKVSFMDLLKHYISKDQASEIIATLNKKGVAMMHGGMALTHDQKRKAARIVTEMTGFRCEDLPAPAGARPAPSAPADADDWRGSMASDNPRRSRSRRNPYAAYFV